MGSGREYNSSFSYAITRPFPFKWFTIGAVIGGIVFTALFTLLNFASSGYDLIIQSSSDPNYTIINQNLVKHWPSFLTTKVRPRCQPIDLPINTQFFTNQTALTYTLTGVWQEHETDGDRVLWPSLTYHNNILQECSITSVEVDMEAMDRSGSQFAYAEWGASVRSYVTCQIINADGVVFFNLTQTYDYVPETISFASLYQFLGVGFLTRNQTSRASLWWGESLMSAYYGDLTWQMQAKRENQSTNGQPAIRKGTMSFSPNATYSDIKSLSFFDVDYRFIADLGNGTFNVIGGGDNVISIPLTIDRLSQQERALTYFTSDLGSTHAANFKPGPADSSYQSLKASTGSLGTTPSVISTKYLCQIPQLKSAGNLIVAVLVADLVLLQTVWQAYKFLVEAYLVKREPTANYCLGCLDKPGGDQRGNNVELEILSEPKYHPLVKTASSENMDSNVE